MWKIPGSFIYIWMKKDATVFFQAVWQALATAHVTVGGIIQQVALQFHLGHFQSSQDIPADPIWIYIRFHFGCYMFRNAGKTRQDFNCQLNTQGVFQVHIFCMFILDALQRVGGWKRTPWSTLALAGLKIGMMYCVKMYTWKPGMRSRKHSKWMLHQT